MTVRLHDDTACLLKLEGVCKQFAGNAVLKGVSLSLHAGEIYALVGGNGAGKSTLMKIITGLYAHDSGSLRINGKEVRIGSPKEAHAHGIYLVPQEPLIFSHMTVEENILIGMTAPLPSLRAKLQELLHSLGWNLHPSQLAGTLSIAEQQLVEILRGLIREAKILILDEPTSTLTFGEIASLFTTIKRLSANGIGLFYITHRFSELFELAHTVAVLRDGVITDFGPIQQFTYQRLLDGLLPAGREQMRQQPARIVTDSHAAQASNRLEVRGLSGNRFHDISFTVRSGEIFGIAGIVGAGRTELAEAICGITRWTQGEVLLGGVSLAGRPLSRRMQDGLVYVPEDRYAHGIFHSAGIHQNITSTVLSRLSRFFLPGKKEQQLSSHLIAELAIQCVGHDQPIGALSGGNQQKAVLAKYLATEPTLIIFDEPTRGIDANARQDIYRMIAQLRRQGLGVILISSDLEEIVQLSDRVMVMFEGKMTAQLEGASISIDAITSAAFGVVQEVASECR